MTQRQPGQNHGFTPPYPLGVPRGDGPLRDEAGKIPPTREGFENTSSPRGRWVQPMVAGIIIGALLSTVTLLGIRNANNWLAPCAHVQQGECYTSTTTKTIGATDD